MMRIKGFINREILIKYRLQSRFCPEIVVVDSRLASCRSTSVDSLFVDSLWRRCY